MIQTTSQRLKRFPVDPFSIIIIAIPLDPTQRDMWPFGLLYCMKRFSTARSNCSMLDYLQWRDQGKNSMPLNALQLRALCQESELFEIRIITCWLRANGNHFRIIACWPVCETACTYCLTGNHRQPLLRSQGLDVLHNLLGHWQKLIFIRCY